MLRAGAVAFGVLLIALRPQAPPAPSAGSGVIVGRVVDAQSGAPVGGVVVALAGAALPRGTEPGAITDAQGRFAFRFLPKGTYTITASTSSSGFSPNGFIVSGSGFPTGPYLNGGFGQRRPNGPLQPFDLADGERVEDALIKMWKAGAIGGQVVDEAGDPLVAQVVGAVQLSSDGHLLTGPTVKTDDRGVFRIGGLIPATYIVFVPLTQVSMPVSVGDEQLSASLNAMSDPLFARRYSAAGAPSPTMGGVQIGTTLVSTTSSAADFGGGGGLITGSLAPLRSGNTTFAYPTTFYPASTTAGTATRIALGSGEERTSLIVALRPLPAAALSGVLTDDAGPVPGMGVHLLPGELNDDASILETAVTATDAHGVFTFPTVPAGSYTIVVARPSGVPSTGPQQPAAEAKRIADQAGAWALQPVSVGGGPVENIAVRLKAPISVSGEVRFSGSAAPPPTDRLRNSVVTVYRSRSLFRAPGGSSGSTIDTAANGRIIIKGVSPPGRFFVGAAAVPAPWSLESVTLAGRDITDAAFRVDDADLADLVLTYTDRPAGVSGTVTSSANAAEPDATVFLIPANRARWADARLSTRTFRMARVSKSRTFSLSSVPPGDYLIAAIRDDDAGAWPDEPFLAKLAAVATSVRVLAGQEQTVALDTKMVG